MPKKERYPFGVIGRQDFGDQFGENNQDQSREHRRQDQRFLRPKNTREKNGRDRRDTRIDQVIADQHGGDQLVHSRNKPVNTAGAPLFFLQQMPQTDLVERDQRRFGGGEKSGEDEQNDQDNHKTGDGWHKLSYDNMVNNN